MIKNISFWLVPTDEDMTALQKIINEICLRYKTPVFVPHLTIWGGIDMEEQKALEIANNIAKESKQFLIEVDKIDTTPNFLKSVFLQIKNNNNLQLIYNKFQQFLKQNNYMLNPHISFVYGNLSDRIKTEIIGIIKQNDTIRNKQIRIDKIVVCTCNKNGWENIEGWKIIFSQKFNL